MTKATTSTVDHPGTFLLEEMEARGWKQVDLAYILGIAPEQLSPLLTGKRAITPEMAHSLSDAFNVSPDFFMNLQKLYDLQRAKPADPGVRTRATWQSVFPVREMIQRGWIEETDPALLDLQMLRFFGKNSINDIPFIGSGEITAHAAKKTGYETVSAIQYAWLHRVMKLASLMRAPLYSEEALRKTLPTIKAHLQDKDDLGRIPQMLRNCGVRFVLVESLPGSKIDGVCVWIDGQPAIGLTLRLDRLDNFAFVLRHECEHVLNGDGRDTSFAPVDEIDATSLNADADLPECELLANAAATEFCIPSQQLNSFLLRKAPFISEQDVLSFAARLEVHPAIVVGQVQHKTQKYAWLRKYQTSIRKYLLDAEFTDGWGHMAPTGL